MRWWNRRQDGDRHSSVRYVEPVASAGDEGAARGPRSWSTVFAMLGPAFVASVAYVDPGNVAANLAAGADFGYLLVWVLVLASLMAMMVQYLSAKLGLVTGRSLSSLVRSSLQAGSRSGLLRGGYTFQALIVACATDLAEVVGGAIALNLLFGLPGWLGGLIVAVVSLVGLDALHSRGEKALDVGISVMLGIIAFGFLAGLVWAPPSPAGVLGGMVPRFDGSESVAISAAMLGATVMPHTIYLHSTLAIDRHRPDGRLKIPLPELLRIQRIDVGGALVVAGTVNVAMLLFGTTILSGVAHDDAVTAAFEVLQARVGQLPAVIFAIGLLASGVGSAVVGTHAGASMMQDLMPRWLASHHLGRIVTLAPALVLLALGVNPTLALIGSQVVLSFGIGFALVPLVWFTSSSRHMGRYASGRTMIVLMGVITFLVLALNVAVIVMSLS